MTACAIGAVYTDVTDNPSSHKEAHLGPEDIRWLKILKSFEDHGAEGR